MRVVRPHTTPSADDAFSPKDPIEVTALDDAPTPDSTSVAAIGFKDVKGVFHEFSGDHIIPEGGTFAYRLFNGQSASVSVGKVKGMTYRYDITVLSANGAKAQVTSVEATYITAATHKALLDGVKFDNRMLAGFDPNKHEYTVRVNDANKYTVQALFDKLSGMSVSSSKEDHKVTLSVRSADGLVLTIYTFHIKENNTEKLLAQTGAPIMLLVFLSTLLSISGTLLLIARKHAKHTHTRHIQDTH